MQLLKLSVQIFLSVGWGDWNHPQSHQICRTVFNLRRESRTENWYIFSFWLRSLCSAGLWNVCGKICLAELDELLSRYARYTVKNSFFFAIYLRIHSVCVCFFFHSFSFSISYLFFSLLFLSVHLCPVSQSHDFCQQLHRFFLSLFRLREQPRWIMFRWIYAFIVENCFCSGHLSPGPRSRLCPLWGSAPTEYSVL